MSYFIPKKRYCIKCGKRFLRTSKGMKMCDACAKKSRRDGVRKRRLKNYGSTNTHHYYLKKAQRIFNANEDDVFSKRNRIIRKVYRLLKNNAKTKYTIRQIATELNEETYDNISNNVSFMARSEKHPRIIGIKEEIKGKGQNCWVVWYDSRNS